MALLLVGIGLFWWQGRAAVERGAPPPEPATAAPDPNVLPSASVSDLRGPAPPEASELTREEQRFFRYDRDRDRKITRNEMLSTRTDAFRALDKDGNNLLTFEEWAVATSDRSPTLRFVVPPGEVTSYSAEVALAHPYTGKGLHLDMAQHPLGYY